MVYSNEIPTATRLLLYGLPAIGLLGLTGNILSFCVMISKKMRKTSYSVYIGALAVMDIANLVHLYSGQFFTGILRMPRPGLLDLCNAKKWFISGSLAAGAWIIVAMTCERCLYIYRPIQSRTRFTVRRATKIVCGIVAAAYVLYVPALFIFPSGKSCNKAEFGEGLIPWTWYATYGHFILISITYTIGPSIGLVILNTAIFVKLRRREANPAVSGSSAVRYQEIGRMVIAVSIIYVVLTVPHTTYFLYYIISGGSFARRRVEDIGPAISIMLLDLNHCINFFIYVLSSPSFRSVICMYPCSRKCGKPQHKSVTTTATALSSIDVSTM